MRRFSVFIALASLLFALNANGLNKHYIENRIQNVKAAIKKKKEGYLKLRAQYVKLIKQTKKTKKDIAVLKKKINKNKQGLSALNKKIGNLKVDIGSISKQLTTQKNELYREFDEYYKYSMTSGYYKKGVWYEYMNSFIIKYMQNKIKRYVSRRLYLKSRLDKLKQYIERKKKILDKIQAQQNTLKSQVRKLSFLTKESLKKRKSYLKQIKQLSLEQDRLQGILKNIIKQEQKRAMEAARRRAAKLKRSKNKAKPKIVTMPGTSGITAYSLKRSFKGLLKPPVAGKIVDTFGKKYDTLTRVTTRNDGIDIKAAKGRCVRAVYLGRVDYVGNLAGYGGVIIINHLNGYYTVYGGVKPKVTVGESVKTQECIGIMQSDRLHFELRRHAEAINPLKLLNRRFLR